MTEALLTLSRRAVAAPGWRWLPGMRIANTKFARVVAVDDGAPCGAEEGATCDDNAAMWLDEWTTPMLPDLSDDLTALGLLKLVREQWDPEVYLARIKDGPDRLWALVKGTTPLHLLWTDAAGKARPIAAPTEVETLVLALEVTP